VMRTSIVSDKRCAPDGLLEHVFRDLLEGSLLCGKFELQHETNRKLGFEHRN
jgi:hypothetical protein